MGQNQHTGPQAEAGLFPKSHVSVITVHGQARNVTSPAGRDFYFSVCFSFSHLQNIYICVYICVCIYAHI